ncbi:MAG: PGPGW domain-containing protein [Candidatus Binatia bacterium]
MHSSNRPERIEEPAVPNDSGNYVLRHARRAIAAVLGTTVLAIGVAMLVLPGPGFLVLFFGLSILAAEFAWARSLVKRLKHEGKRVIPERWRRFFGGR